MNLADLRAALAAAGIDSTVLRTAVIVRTDDRTVATFRPGHGGAVYDLIGWDGIHGQRGLALTPTAAAEIVGAWTAQYAR